MHTMKRQGAAQHVAVLSVEGKVSMRKLPSGADEPWRRTLLFCGIFCAVTIFAAEIFARERPACFDESTVKVTISGRLFAVPVHYRTLIVRIDGAGIAPESSVTHPQCRKGQGRRISEPIEARSFSILGLNSEQARRAQVPMFHQVPLQVNRRPPDQSIELQGIRKFNDRVQRSGRRVQDLPQVAGFYAYERIEGVKQYRSPFMAIPGGMTSPYGNPIVVKCHGNPIAHPRYPRPTGPDPSCTVDYDWAEGIAIHYGFSEGIHPIGRWAELDAAVRTFVNHLAAETGK